MEKELQIVEDAWEKLTNHISKYLNLKKDFLENEYVQLLGDSIKVIGFVKSASQLIIQKKFESFLNGFTLDKTPTEEQIKKLIEYIDDETKAEFIADTFTKILLSNSSKACLLMGTLLKSIADEGEELEHSKLVCVSALTTFFDVDLRNFKSIIDFIDEKSRKKLYVFDDKKIRRYMNFNLEGLSGYSKRNNLNYSSILLTIEKCVSSQLISRTYEADISVDYDKDTELTSVDNKELEEYYHMNEAGLLLKTYLERVNL